MDELKTRIENLDNILGGGIPGNSMTFIVGAPGTGKTILTQQILFSNKCKSLYLTTLSEPTFKVIKYMQEFEFFDQDAFGERVIYQDIGQMVRTESLDELLKHITKLVEDIKPEILCIDSIRAIGALVKDETEFRKFIYDLSILLSTSNCTSLLIGEYSLEQLEEKSEFAIADGIFYVSIEEFEGDEQRTLRVLKLRGRAVNISTFPFEISNKGIHIIAPAFTIPKIRRKVIVDEEKIASGISGLDELLKGGFPKNSSSVVSGTSGTGKTTFAIQFLGKGAELGEKGLLISIEETPERLIQKAKSFRISFEEFIETKLIKIVYIPQNEIKVKKNMEELTHIIKTFKPDRIVVDSLSIFLHKIKDESLQREKVFELCNLAKINGATSVFISDIMAGETRISRFGVEETIMDGVIVLSTTTEATKRKRYIEVYKLRASEHVYGKYRMDIGSRGIEAHYLVPTIIEKAPLSLEFPALDPILRNCHFGSAWLVRGEQGSGKSTLAYQFAIEGLRRKESVLYLAFDTSAYDVKREMESWQVLVSPYIETGYLKIIEALPTSEHFLDLTDSERIIYAIDSILKTMPKPCRVVMDSLTPVAVHVTAENFVRFIDYKNRVLRRIDVALFDTILTRSLSENTIYSSLNSYDIVLDLKTPDWGEMKGAGHDLRAIEVRKARGAVAETQMCPYIIRRGEGLVIQKEVTRRS
ncbi:MAG: ATPase domain-containing protein [Candidatus Heimdallarchaeaceae archaeon]